MTAQTTGAPGVTFKSRIVPKAQFSASNLIRIGRAEAQSNPGLVQVWFFTSHADVSALLSEITTMEGRSYNWWKAAYEEAVARKWTVARFSAWKDSAVLQIRDANDTISRRTVYGQDFLTIAEDGVFANVVDVSIFRRTSGPSDVTINLRIAGRLDQKAAIKVWDRFHDLGAGSLSIDLRHDPWFVDSFRARVFKPFEPGTRIPTEDEVKQLPSLSCVGRPADSAPRCTCRIGDRSQNDIDRCL